MVVILFCDFQTFFAWLTEILLCRCWVMFVASCVTSCVSLHLNHNQCVVSFKQCAFCQIIVFIISFLSCVLYDDGWLDIYFFLAFQNNWSKQVEYYSNFAIYWLIPIQIRYILKGCVCVWSCLSPHVLSRVFHFLPITSIVLCPAHHAHSIKSCESIFVQI